MNDSTNPLAIPANPRVRDGAESKRMAPGKAPGGNLPAGAGGVAGTVEGGNVVLGIDPGSSTGLAFFKHGELIDLQTIAPHQIPAVIKCASRVIFVSMT